MRGHERCVELLGEHFPPPHHLFAMVSPADAQTAAAPASDRLPAVTVNPPEARPRNRPKPARREQKLREIQPRFNQARPFRRRSAAA